MKIQCVSFKRAGIHSLFHFFQISFLRLQLSNVFPYRKNVKFMLMKLATPNVLQEFNLTGRNKTKIPDIIITTLSSTFSYLFFFCHSAVQYLDGYRILNNLFIHFIMGNRTYQYGQLTQMPLFWWNCLIFKMKTCNVIGNHNRFS